MRKLAVLIFLITKCLLAVESLPANEFETALLAENYREAVAQFTQKYSAPNEKMLISALETMPVSLERKKFVYSLLAETGAKASALPLFLSSISKRRNYQNPNELAWMADEASEMVLQNPEVFKEHEEALVSKLHRLIKEPAVIGNLRSKPPFEEKMAIAQVLSRAGSKEAISFILEEIKKPLDLEVPEANRPNYSRLAKTLSAAIKQNPALLDTDLKNEIRTILASKDPAFTAAQNDLNKYLPKDLTQVLDKEVTHERLDPSNIDPCSVMCRVAKALSEKINDSLSIPSDKYLASNEAKSSFSFAVRSLMGEFLMKANQTGCEIPGIQTKLNMLLVEATALAKSDETRGEVRHQGDTREAVRASGASEAAIKSALAFLDKTQGSSNTDAKGLPTNNATLYFYIQTQRVAEAMRKSGSQSDPQLVALLQEKIGENLSRILDGRKELLDGDGGSLVTTYALAAIGSSMPEGSNIQKRVAQIFSELRDNYKNTGGAGFPYNLNPQILKETERAGAARSVVAQLAIYKGGKSEEKLANADQLLTSLGIYDKHFRDIFSGIGLNRTHDRDDSDQLAPYYGPSTIPYVFEAVSLLRKEKNLSGEQQEKLHQINLSLQKKLLGMFEPNGLFQAQNSNYYSAAPLYDNALTGLALQQACQDKRKPEPSETSAEVLRTILPKRNH
ncbi:MAG: hypothetical protein EBQ92_10635 [Proteobacteria bacterium]|nr:hypothetical protein [Pseudomonadota bacterium]